MKNYNLKAVIANYLHRFKVTEIKIPTAFLVAFEEVWVSKSYKTLRKRIQLVTRMSDIKT